MLNLIDSEDMQVGRKRKGKKNGNGNDTKILTKKTKKEKENLIEKLGLKGKKRIEVKKTIRIPIHYDVTKKKIDIVDNLTARLTYCMRLISSDIVYDMVTDSENNKNGDIDDLDNILKLKVIEEEVYNSDIVEKTGLSSGYIQQCINKVIWAWRQWKKQYKEWEGKMERAEERLYSARDDKEIEKAGKWSEKLGKREPSKPTFENKTSCRLDYRTGTVEEGKGKLSQLWINISTLEKNKTVEIPLNPSHYHLDQLKDAVVDDFEIIKNDKYKKGGKKKVAKYYIHVSITKVIEEKPINSIGGIDQGLNKSIAAVLIGLDGQDRSFPREEQLLDSARVELLEKYDDIVSSLQEAEKWNKLRQMRGKRENVSVYHDWVLANNTAKFTEGSYLAIGNSKFRQSQYRGNQMPGLRKRVGKWSYSRQRKMISLKRAENGYMTELWDEYGTSRECCDCHSKFVRRVWMDGFSYLLCFDCGYKKDADISAGYVIATRCRDDMLKAGMITMTNGVSR